MPISSQELLTLNGDAAFLWDLRTMSHRKSYRSHGAVTEASFSFDGRFVTTGSRSVKIWDAATGLSVSKLENPHRGPVRSVQFSPVGPGYVLATAGDDGVARVWTWDPKGKEFQKVREFVVRKRGPNEAQDAASTTAIHSLSFSADGRLLLAAGARGTVRLWNLADRGQVSFDVDQPVTFSCGDFSSDSQWIAAGSDDKLARMWKIPAAGASAEPPIIFEGHADRIEDIQILMDGSTQPRVLTAARDKSARVWDPRLDSDERIAREIVTLRKHTQGVTAIDVTSDGNLLMTAGRDGAVILWPAAPREPATEPENVFDNL
jgi:WD40 repeat protein